MDSDFLFSKKYLEFGDRKKSNRNSYHANLYMYIVLYCPFYKPSLEINFELSIN